MAAVRRRWAVTAGREAAVHEEASASSQLPEAAVNAMQNPKVTEVNSEMAAAAGQEDAQDETAWMRAGSLAARCKKVTFGCDRGDWLADDIGDKDADSHATASTDDHPTVSTSDGYDDEEEGGSAAFSRDDAGTEHYARMCGSWSSPSTPKSAAGGRKSCERCGSTLLG